MDRTRFKFLKTVAKYFQENPGATHYLGVSRQTCFSILALQFSTPEEILDPIHPDLLTKTEERINQHEEAVQQNQPPPKTVDLSPTLENTIRSWQKAATENKPPEQREKTGRYFNKPLRSFSLETWQKVKPEWTPDIGRFMGKSRIFAATRRARNKVASVINKNKYLNKIAKVFGRVAKGAGVVGFAIAATFVSAKIIKEAIKYLGLPLYFLYNLFAALGTAAMVGFAAGAVAGGLAGGVAGAIFGAKLGAAIGFAVGGPVGAVVGAVLGGLVGFTVGLLGGALIGGVILGSLGYALEHWAWRPLQNTWAASGDFLGAAGNFLGNAWSGLTTAAGNFFSGVLIGAGNAISGALSAVGGAATATGSFLAGLGAQLSSLSLAPLATVPVIGTISAATIFTFWMNTSVVGTAFMRQPGQITSAVPSGPGGPPPPGGYGCTLAANTPGSDELKKIINEASFWAKIPPAVLGAILSIEGRYVYGYSPEEVRLYAAPCPDATDTWGKPSCQAPNQCKPNECTARGPMQFTTQDTVTASCGRVYNTWGVWKNSVREAIPTRQFPDVCNITDSLYAAAAKIRWDSGMTDPSMSCGWSKAITDRVSTAYFGSTACTTPWSHLSNEELNNPTYCEYVWWFYQKYNQDLTPPASSCPVNNGVDLCGSFESSHPTCRHCYPGMYGPPYCDSYCNNNGDYCERAKAVDVSGPGGGANFDVFLPTIFGETLQWAFLGEAWVQNGVPWGWEKKFAAQSPTSGKRYDLRLLHLEQGNPTLNVGTNYSSGTRVGRFWDGRGFPYSWAPHTHVTINEGGLPRPADNYFKVCGF